MRDSRSVSVSDPDPIVDDQSSFRKGIAALVNAEPDMNLAFSTE
jgi:hypothetical protein